MPGRFIKLFYEVFLSRKLGKKAVNIPIRGRNAHNSYTYSMLVLSASTPNTAEPNPPIPKAKPKNSPETRPILPGNNSCAYTSMAEKAEAIIIPMKTVRMQVKKRLAWGSKSVNGAAPKIENHITYFLPKRSPKGPPRIVPAATANKKMNRYICDVWTGT